MIESQLSRACTTGNLSVNSELDPRLSRIVNEGEA